MTGKETHILLINQIDLCPKTCFRCPGPDSDTFNTPSCQDKDVSCRAKKRLCRSTNKSVSGRIKKQCPKTCNLCDSSGVEEDTSCENKQIECHSIKFLCKSRNKGYLKFMRKHCPSTCSLCKELENDEEEAGCSDVDKNCQEKLDLCDHPTFSKAMNKDCKASCSVC
uniref:ShKT domain-containing protein n=1 Tax=Rhabditophanes sp. KR3021 TaxID=114890 RepID=A0AC35TXC0_9BILA